MSSPESDRKLRSKSGKTIPSSGGGTAETFVDTVAAALRADYGNTPAAVKHVARLTGANQRAVRNWFEAKNGPSGENLVALLQHSDSVFLATLSMAGRPGVAAALKVVQLRSLLLELINEIDRLT